MISLGLGPGNSVDKVEGSLASFSVGHSNARVGVEGVQRLMQLGGVVVVVCL